MELRGRSCARSLPEKPDPALSFRFGASSGPQKILILGNNMRTGKRILVIDDDPGVLDVLSEFLTIKDFNVVCSKDGFEGLERVEADPHGFDLIITDIRMPFISGIGLIQIVKEKYAHIPVVAITGEGEIAMESSLAARANVVLYKPFQLEAFTKIIRDLLSAGADGQNAEKDPAEP